MSSSVHARIFEAWLISHAATNSDSMMPFSSLVTTSTTDRMQCLRLQGSVSFESEALSIYTSSLNYEKSCAYPTRLSFLACSISCPLRPNHRYATDILAKAVTSSDVAEPPSISEGDSSTLDRLKVIA